MTGVLSFDILWSFIKCFFLASIMVRVFLPPITCKWHVTPTTKPGRGVKAVEDQQIKWIDNLFS